MATTTKVKAETKTLVAAALISAAIGAAAATGFLALSGSQVHRANFPGALSSSYLPGYVQGYFKGFVPGYGSIGYVPGYGMFQALSPEEFQTELRKYIRPNVINKLLSR